MGLAGAVVVAGALTLLLRAPLPPPRIIRTVQLTSDGREKRSFPVLATDGLRVYFVEQVGGRQLTVAAVSTSGGATVEIPSPFPSVDLLGISPDGSELLVNVAEANGIDHAVWAMPMPGGSPRRLGDIVAHDAAWSPDGQRIAYAKGGDIYLAKSDGSESRKLISTNSGAVPWRPRWSPDGRRLRFNTFEPAKGTGRLWELTAEGTNLHLLLPGWDKGPVQGFGDWTPDGKYFVFQSPDIWAMRDKVGFFDRASRVPVRLTMGGVDFWAPLPSRDGKRLFVFGAQPRAELVRYDTKLQRFSTYLSGVSAESVSFSRDGAWVAYVKYPQREIWRSKVDGSQQVQLTFPPLVAYGPRWSPDGKQIAFFARLPGKEWNTYLVASEGGIPSRALPAEEGTIDATWSPDGNSLMFERFGDQREAGIQILDLQTHRLSSVPGSKGLSSPRWSPDGRYIAAILPPDKLVLFDFTTQKWVELARMSGGVEFESWSRDGKYIYFESYEGYAAIFRIRIGDRKLERVVGLKDVPFIPGDFDGGFSLDPVDSLVIPRDVTVQEVYALDWEVP